MSLRDIALTNCAAALYGEPWAILPSKLEALVAVFSDRRNGIPAALGDWEAVRAERAKLAALVMPGASVRDVRGMSVRQIGRVAVLPMFGTITQRPGMFSRYSGGTSAEQFAAAHEELVGDSSVASIVWDVDSPGGSVAGVPEAADRLLSLRGQKKTVAVSNSMMASAAYWLASAADEIVATPSSLTGSIGVYTVHEDRSRANAIDGVHVTYVYAGKKKVEGNPDAPLSSVALLSMQEMVNDYYGQFVAAVAKHRRVSQAAVRDGFGEGDVLTAKRAAAAGLADRIETLPQVLERFGGKPHAARASELAAAIQRQAEAQS